MKMNMKGCSALLMIKDMQIKITLLLKKCIRVAKIKRLLVSSASFIYFFYFFSIYFY